jgi:hypothetical protein
MSALCVMTTMMLSVAVGDGAEVRMGTVGPRSRGSLPGPPHVKMVAPA